MIAFQIAPLPDLLASLGIQTGGSIGAEVDVDLPFFNERRRRRIRGCRGDGVFQPLRRSDRDRGGPGQTSAHAGA